jgi:hypothetical protein
MNGVILSAALLLCTVSAPAETVQQWVGAAPKSEVTFGVAIVEQLIHPRLAAGAGTL